MPIKPKFLVVAVCALSLAISSVALASGLTIKTTPTRAKVGKTVQMLVKGLKPGEKVKAKEFAPFGQTRTLFPSKRANASGVVLVAVQAQIKGKHRWVFTGRTSHRTGSTAYYVR
jgi:hypothetical protein